MFRKTFSDIKCALKKNQKEKEGLKEGLMLPYADLSISNLFRNII